MSHRARSAKRLDGLGVEAEHLAKSTSVCSAKARRRRQARAAGCHEARAGIASPAPCRDARPRPPRRCGAPRSRAKRRPGQIADLAAGHLFSLQRRDPFGRRALAEDIDELRDEHVAIEHPVARGRKARIGRKIRPADDLLAQGAELAVIADREHEIAVRRLEELVRGERRMGVAEALAARLP